jgi:CMP/dCMP kinase
MSVITISRQFGSGGDEIAAQVCDALWYRIFDKHMITEAAKAEGISVVEMGDFSEEDRQTSGFFLHLFSHPLPAFSAKVWKEGIDGSRSLEDFVLDETEAFSLTQKAVKAACQVGNMVIVGRGGQVILQGVPDVVHVRIVAPLENRIQRVKEQLKIAQDLFLADIEMRRNAQDLILSRDAASEEYLKRFYHVDWDSPMLYDLVINTASLTLQKSVEIITGLVKSNQPPV